MAHVRTLDTLLLDTAALDGLAPGGGLPIDASEPLEGFDDRRTVIEVEPESSVDRLRRCFALQGSSIGDGIDVDARSRSLREDWAHLRRAALEGSKCRASS